VAFDDADVSSSNGQSGNRHSGKGMLFVLIRHVGAARNSSSGSGSAAAADSAGGRRTASAAASAAASGGAGATGELPRRMEPIAGTHCVLHLAPVVIAR
jgi:hypothetical protein